jgi:hypothetical protein
MTYQSFSSRNEDPALQKFLSETTIQETKDGAIVFQRKTKDPMMMNILMLPIIRSDMVENMKTGRIALSGYITSGQYVLADILDERES